MRPERVVETLTEVYVKTAGRIVPLLVGESGVGKTMAYQQVAQRMEQVLHQPVTVRYFHLAHMSDVGDIIGLPERVNGRTIFARNALFPTDADVEQGEATRYGILVFDEPNRARRDLLNVLLELLVSRRVGSHQLAADWVIGLAANPSTAEYVVEMWDRSFETRVMQLRYENSPSDWVRYARARGLNGEVIRAIQASATQVEQMMRAEQEWTLRVRPSYRALERVADLLTHCQLDKASQLECVAGLVGTEMAVLLLKALEEERAKPLEAESVLNGSLWEAEGRARWEAILQQGAVDLRNATIDNVLDRLAKVSVDSEAVWETAWSAEALGEFILSLPQDVSQMVVSRMGELVDRDRDGAVATWRHATAAGLRVLQELLQRMIRREEEAAAGSTTEEIVRGISL